MVKWAVLIIWQDLDPLSSAKARAARDARSFIHNTWSHDGISVHVHDLWNSEFSLHADHRALTLQWLRSCVDDKSIAMHAFAARANGTLSEVESIGRELLSLDLQLERALGASLLAWHPEGDTWLEALVERDPSAWVREHAKWAVKVCRRDRLACTMYREALSASNWLKQQARLEGLVPLILPTFLRWPNHREEIQDLKRALSPRRRALLLDFEYFVRRGKMWHQIVGRDLEKFCRGENISIHLELGEKGPPWLPGRRFKLEQASKAAWK